MKYLVAVPLLLLCCCRKDGTANYNGYATDPALALHSVRMLLDEFYRIEKPFPEGSAEPFAQWYVIKNDSRHEIGLPHKWHTPNSDQWLEAEASFPSTGFIEVSADDGAQVYVSGKRISSQFGKFFPVDSGYATVRVRVMNNAMSGGLKEVKFCSKEEFDLFKIRKVNYERLSRLAFRLQAVKEPSGKMIDVFQNALSMAEKGIAQAEIEFADYPFLIGPTILHRSKSHVTISVVSDSLEPIELRYGPSPNALSQSIRKRGQNIFFEVALNSMTDSLLYYRVQSKKLKTKIFSISLKEEQKFSFNAWADSQGGWSTFYKNIKNNKGHHDAFGIGIGDLVSNGSDITEWMKLFEVLSVDASARPYFLLTGNHDYDGYYDSLQSRNFDRFTNYSPSPYYAWSYANCAFIGLDVNMNFPVGIRKKDKQFRWLMEQFESEEWRNAVWRFVLLHQPPISQGWKGYHGDTAVSNLLQPLLAKHNIDFVLAGHTHDYERLTTSSGNQSTHFLIVGGGGGEIEPPESSDFPKMDTVIKKHHMGRFYVDGKKITFKVFDLEDRVIDSVTWRKY